MSFKIIFAGTPAFSAEILQSLLGSHHHIIAVYTQPDRPAGRGQALTPSPVKQLAVQHNIPLYQPQSLKDPEEHAKLHALHADIMIVAAYGLILPAPVLRIPKHGCINVHTSILPRWRGAAPIQHAILAGDLETGVSIMQMDAGLDTGDVLLTAICPIQSTDTSGRLTQKLATLGSETLLNALEKLAQETLVPIKQDNSKATYAHKISKQQAEIDWKETAIILDRKIRAFNDWPVAFTRLHDQIIRIWTATPLETNLNKTPGTIIQATPTGMDVATGQGTLRLLEIQLPGKKRMPVKEILNAKNTPFQPGETFGAEPKKAFG